MPEYTKKIVYLSNAQYQELITNKTITANNTSIDYDKNTLYITPQNTPIYEQDLATVAITGDYEDLSNKPEVPVQDIQVNGTSILSNKIANIPVATTSSIGMVRCGNGLYMGNNGGIHANFCSGDQIKTNASILSTAIPPASLYRDMVFYGLARVAGDTTQSASSNSIGTYTNEAKVAIQQMLGLDTTTVNITETDPTIVAQANRRYICGEVTSINFTPSTSGLCELIFTSGSTVAVLTLPSTVKMPEWFEVEPERIYDIIITDGIYGAVTSWAM